MLLNEQNIGWDIQWGSAGPQSSPIGEGISINNCPQCGPNIVIVSDPCSGIIEFVGSDQIGSIYIALINLDTGEATPLTEGMSQWGIPVMGTPDFDDDGTGNISYTPPSGGSYQLFIMQGDYYGPGNNVYDGAAFQVYSYSYTEQFSCGEDSCDNIPVGCCDKCEAHYPDNMDVNDTCYSYCPCCVEGKWKSTQSGECELDEEGEYPSYESCMEGCAPIDESGYNCRPGHIGGTSMCVPCIPGGPCEFASEQECIESGCEEQSNDYLLQKSKDGFSVKDMLMRRAGLKR